MIIWLMGQFQQDMHLEDWLPYPGVSDGVVTILNETF